jgi:aspartate racemase
MSPRRLKTIGVLGGMGPEATGYFYERILANTAASSDQDHVPVVVVSLPRIPDRTKAILHGGRSPLPTLLEGAETLRRAGADFIVLPCISAHYFRPALAARSPLPVLDLLDETLKALRRQRPSAGTFGLIATTGTVRSRIVHDRLEPAGLRVIVPSAAEQKRVMTAIYGKRGVKSGVTSGPPREALLEVAASLVRRGARAIFAGCTEVPLVVRAADLPVPLVEPMDIGARAAVRRAGGRLKG